MNKTLANRGNLVKSVGAAYRRRMAMMRAVSSLTPAQQRHTASPEQGREHHARGEAAQMRPPGYRFV
ncbi:hypothetical protein D3C86_2201170 [compost metagenome]